MLIETHAHLDYPDFAPDFADVLRRAEEADVTRIITIGTSLESSMRAVELAEKYPSVFAVIGVHPTYAEEAVDDVIDPLRELAKSRRVVAIGETGLDYHRLPSVELSKHAWSVPPLGTHPVWVLHLQWRPAAAERWKLAPVIRA